MASRLEALCFRLKTFAKYTIFLAWKNLIFARILRQMAKVYFYLFFFFFAKTGKCKYWPCTL